MFENTAAQIYVIRKHSNENFQKQNLLRCLNFVSFHAYMDIRNTEKCFIVCLF